MLYGICIDKLIETDMIFFQFALFDGDFGETFFQLCHVVKLHLYVPFWYVGYAPEAQLASRDPV